MPTTAQEESSGTLDILWTSGTEDIDPHYTYSELASAVALLVYEMLLILKGDSTDEFEPMLAESWEVSEDQSTYTFKLFPDVMFQDGTPANAQAVKDSYTRWIELGGSPVNVITRFCDSPDKMEVVDETTLRFNLGSPQPLFLAAMASSYGPMVISPTALAENATEEDPYAHEWAKAFAVGSGPYILESNSVSEGLILAKFDGYHRGWEGNHFDGVIFRVVPEDATRRQLLERGEADAAASNLTIDALEALRSNPAVQVVEYPTTAVTWAIMNAPRLLTKEVRQGFSYAFPYDDVLNVVYKGLLKRSGPIADSVRGYDPDVFLYQTDLDKAKELILVGRLQGGRCLRVHGRRQRGDSSRQSPSSSRPTSRRWDSISSSSRSTTPRSSRPSTETRHPRSARTSSAAGAGGRTTTIPGTSSGRTSPRPTSAAADQTEAPGSTRASRRSWPRRSTSKARSNSTS